MALKHRNDRRSTRGAIEEPEMDTRPNVKAELSMEDHQTYALVAQHLLTDNSVLLKVDSSAMRWLRRRQANSAARACKAYRQSA
jgi:hypothetical protein